MNVITKIKQQVLPAVFSEMKDRDEALGAIVANQKLVSLELNANKLTATLADGTVTPEIDLSLYLDDTNLAQLVSGRLDGTTGVVKFLRDDNSSFTIDLSPLLDDLSVLATDAEYVTGTTTVKAATVKQVKDSFVELATVYHPLQGDATLFVVGKDADEATQQFVTANQFEGTFTAAEATALYNDL